MAKEKQSREEVLARVPQWTHELINWDKTLGSDSNVYVNLPEDAKPAGETVCGFVSADKGSQVNFQFCMRVPSGTSAEELNASCLEIYGIDLGFMLRTAVLSFSRSADDKAKPELFDGKEPSEEKFRKMQEKFASWKPGDREKRAVSPESKAAKLVNDLGDNAIVIIATQAFLLGKMDAETFRMVTGQEPPSSK